MAARTGVRFGFSSLHITGGQCRTKREYTNKQCDDYDFIYQDLTHGSLNFVSINRLKQSAIIPAVTAQTNDSGIKTRHFPGRRLVVPANFCTS
jgi:hypothetical protein